LGGENFGEWQAKLYFAKKILANLSPAPIASSDIISNWRIHRKLIVKVGDFFSLLSTSG